MRGRVSRSTAVPAVIPGSQPRRPCYIVASRVVWRLRKLIVGEDSESRIAAIRLALLCIVILCGADAVPRTAPTSSAAPLEISAFHGGGGMLGVAPPIGPPPMRVRWSFSTRDDESVVALAPAPTSSPTTAPHRGGQAGIEGAPTIDGQSVYFGDGEGVLRAGPDDGKTAMGLSLRRRL